MDAPDASLPADLQTEYRARFLLEVSKAATSHLDLAEVLEAISAALRGRAAFDAIGLVVIEGDRLSLHSLCSNDTPRLPGESVYSLLARVRAKRGNDQIQGRMVIQVAVADSCVSEFAKTRSAYVCENLEAQIRFPEEELLFKNGIRGYISVPLMKRECLLGAVHFLTYRPRAFHPEEIQLIQDASSIVSIAVSNALAYEKIKTLQEQLKHENEILQSEIEAGSMFEEIVGSSPLLARVLEQVDRVAPTDATVLLTGETGTGKELIARAIHRRSARADRAMVKVNCASLPQELIASELFGHEKGAFTGALQRRLGRFEVANGGTIFLDEIGELPPMMQIALLRVLQEREFERVGGNATIHTDVRVIAATNRDLRREVAEGHFREDLFYRLNVFPIECPALRDRRDDIPLLVEYFASRFAARMGKTIDQIDRETFNALLRYTWPGNIRELQNVVERAVILADGRGLRLEPGILATNPVLPGPSGPPPPLTSTPAEERDRQRAEIEAVLRDTGGRISGQKGAARRLGIPASTLESRIRNLGINKHAYRWRA
ncbi:MAG TPA: sigma 54-interacting transcriptional regulator [Bryobacteraceae bacterium]|nr:sigma 54-interacting transcriptional regulator [Bryobacteraceae bacterium]